MNTKDAILAQIIDEPGDDLPRMVFADWCDDHGDPDRADFIRAQLRLAKMPAWHPERLDLEERSLDLLAAHRAEWLAHLPPWARKMHPDFRRGFVGAVNTGPDQFERQADELASIMPLEAVRLIGADYRGQLGGVEALNRVRELNLTQMVLSPVAQQAFFGSPRPGLRVLHGTFPAMCSGWPGLGHLDTLHYRGSRFTEEGARGLLDSPGVENLAALELESQAGGMEENSPGLSNDMLDALAGCRRLKGLRRLVLTLGVAGEAERLAAADWPGLEEFRLHIAIGKRYRVEDRGLLRAPWMPALRSLSFGIPGAADSLADAQPGRLASLSLSGAEADGIRALCRGGRLAGLTRLHLWCDVQEGDEAGLLNDLLDLPALTDLALHLEPPRRRQAGPLASHPGAARLRSLAPARFRLGPEGAAELARSPHLRPARLDLSDNHIGDRGLEDLLRADWLPSLRELRLGGNDIGDASVRALAACPGLSRLRVLDLLFSRVTEAGALTLARSPHLGRLLHLSLDSNDFEDSTCDQLRERFGDALSLWAI
jgi:uncharacterized protein (TIGR02996 family)